MFGTSTSSNCPTLAERTANSRAHLGMYIAMCILASILACALCLPGTAHAIKTVNQKEYAFQSCGKSLVFVNNKSYGKYIVKNYDRYPANQYTANEHGTLKGNTVASLRTFIFLPMSYQKSGDMGNPQSLNITPDGHYAYIAYPKSKTSEHRPL